MAARDFNDLSGEHPGLVACQKQDGIGNVFGLDQLAHRNDRNDGFLQFIINPSCLRGAGSNTLPFNP